MLLSQYPAQGVAGAAARDESWPAASDFQGSLPLETRGAGARLRNAMRVFFFAVTLVGLFGMAGALSQLFHDSPEATDALTVVLGALLAVTAFSQVRGFVTATPFGGRLLRRNRPPQQEPAANPNTRLLTQADPGSTELGHSFGPPQLRTLAAYRAVSTRGFTFVGVAAGGIAVSASIVGLVYGVSVGGVDVYGLAVSGFYALLMGFGYVQFVRILRQAGWRCAPRQLARRALYDSNRLYSGSNLVMQLGLTGAATAVVASAGLAPIAFPGNPDFRILGFDSETTAIYRINPKDGALVTFPPANEQLSLSPLAAVPASIRSINGIRVPKGSALTLVYSARRALLAVIEPRAGHRTSLGEMNPPPGTVAGLGLLRGGQPVILDAAGNLSRGDLSTGQWMRLASTGISVTTATFDTAKNRFLAVSGPRLVLIDIATGRTADLGESPALSGLDACGVALISGRIVVADRATRSLVAISSKTRQAIGTIGPSPLGPAVCGIVSVH